LRLKELNVELIDFHLPRIKSKNPIRLILSIFVLTILSLKISLIIKKWDVSLIHTISNKRSAIFGILGANLAKIPAIWSIRNLQWEGFIDAFLIKKATRLIGVSNAIINLFDRKAKYHHKFITIYNAIDLADFNPELNLQRPLLKKWGIEPHDFIVAMVGRLTPEKGYEEFIDAASQISKDNSRIKFLIIGEQNFYGNDQYYRSLVQKCQDRHLNSTLKFIGFEKNISAIMASIDLLVLFSQHESFGRVLIEAMAMEKPVIASDCGGPGEIVINNQTGILLSTRDVSRLTDAILYLNNNPVIARRMGEAGRKRVEQYFLVKDYVQNHEKLYQEILG